jgi:hypothetical protein
METSAAPARSRRARLNTSCGWGLSLLSICVYVVALLPETFCGRPQLHACALPGCPCDRSISLPEPNCSCRSLFVGCGHMVSIPLASGYMEVSTASFFRSSHGSRTDDADYSCVRSPSHQDDRWPAPLDQHEDVHANRCSNECSGWMRTQSCIDAVDEPGTVRLNQKNRGWGRTRTNMAEYMELHATAGRLPGQTCVQLDIHSAQFQ